MAQMATISARIDKNDKTRFDEFCSTVGMNASTAINMFVKTVLRRQEIPFTIESAEDPFYSEANMAHLRQAIKELNEGKGVEHEIVEVD